jgi:hypothetical protein
MKKLLCLLFPLLFGAEIRLPGQVVEIDGVACASSTFTDGGVCVVPPDPDPDPIPDPVGTINRVAIMGCSNTNNWVGELSFLDGFENYVPERGDFFTSTRGYGGGSIESWLDPTGRWQGLFINATTGDEDIILIQLCVVRDRATIADVRALVAFAQEHVPGKPVYVMPIGAAPPLCSFAGRDKSIELYFQAAAEGVALLGPLHPDFFSPYELFETKDGRDFENGDGCHPNPIGTRRVTDEILRWLEIIEG